MSKFSDVLGLLGKSATGAKIVAELEATEQTAVDRAAAAKALADAESAKGTLAAPRAALKAAQQKAIECQKALIEAQRGVATAHIGLRRAIKTIETAAEKARRVLVESADPAIGEFLREINLSQFSNRNRMDHVSEKLGKAWLEAHQKARAVAEAMQLEVASDDVAMRLAALRNAIEAIEEQAAGLRGVSYRDNPQFAPAM
jgi:hypothetical protein